MESQEIRDRLSALPEILLLSVLDRVWDVKSLGRTGVLSKRWKRLPWLVSDLNMETSCFYPEGLVDSKSSSDLHRAMGAFAEATKRFLAAPASERTIKKVCLEFYFVEGSSTMSDIAASLGEAIAGGKLARDCGVELFIAASSSSNPSSLSGQCLMELTREYPDVLGRLNTLCICNALFEGSDDLARILRTCTHLKRLSLFECDWKNGTAVVEIDAPAESRLRELDIYECLRRILLRQAPKLEVLSIRYASLLNFPDSEEQPHAPLVLANNSVVPCLKELEITTRIDGASLLNLELSEMLGRNATAHLEDLSLNFSGCKMWIKPEDPTQLIPAFGKLKSLTISGIKDNYDLSWTLLLLRAAPTLEKLKLNISFNDQDQPGEIEWQYELFELSWRLLQKTSDFKHCSLKRLEFIGFVAEGRQIQYIRLVLKHAASLKEVVLWRNYQLASFKGVISQRNYCEAESTFTEDERDLIVKQLKEGISSMVQIAIY